jgi:hypothetical protein
VVVALRRGAALPVRYVRAGPVTSVLLAVVLGGHALLGALLADPGVVIARLSTDLDNLARHPLTALPGSLLVVPGPLLGSGLGGTVITLVLGFGVALWWFEVREGSPAAVAVVLAGHVGATLLTVPVILWAVASGRYPPEVRSTLDVGVSYAAEAALAAATVLVPRWARPAWLLFVVGWPLLDADWYGPLPDFTTVGHLWSAAIGLTFGVVAARRGRRPAGG